jgi:hypothetical protein
MTALLLANYNQFYSGTVFNNLAYDVALTIRQAQTYGISVKVNDQTLNNFNAAYGVGFDTGLADQFILYADTTSPTGYNSTDTTEKKYHLKQGATVNNLCVGMNIGNCGPNFDTLNIIFQRPNPEAKICANNNCNWKYAEIRVKSGMGSIYKTIKVTNVGQISVAI